MTRSRVLAAALAIVAGSAGLAVAQERSGRQRTPTSNATARLDDARLVLATLAEESMSQDARDALGALRQEFHALYRSYTGKDMNRIAARAADARIESSMSYPRGVWQNFYAEVQQTLDHVLGPQANATKVHRGGPADTSASDLIAGVPRSTLRRFEDLRDRLNAFHRAAMAETRTGQPARERSSID